MEINGTLFIQIINFGIAYYCLRELLFRPVVALLEQEAIKREHINAEIESRKLKVQELEQRKQAEWAQFQEFFVKNRPVLLQGRFLFKDLSVAATQHELSLQEKQGLIDELQVRLVTKVRDVH